MVNPYDAIVKDQADAAPVANPYDAVVLDFQKHQKSTLRASVNEALQSNPDQYAKARDISQRSGVPASVVERNLPVLEKRDSLNRYDELLQANPVLAEYMRSPDFAKLIHDDLDNATLVEKTAGVVNRAGRNIAAGFGPRTAAGIYGVAQAGSESVAGLLDPLVRARVLPANPAAEAARFFAERRRIEEAYAEHLAGDLTNAGTVERGVYSGLQSLGQNVPMLAGGFLLRNPNLSLMGMSGLVAGQEYGQARDEGLPLHEAFVFGLSQAAVEYATEKIPVGRLFGDLLKDAGFFKTLLGQVATEIPGEQVATVLQDLNQWAVLNPDKPFADYLAERPSAAAETLIATLVAAGGQTAAIQATDAVARRIAGESSRADQAGAHLARLAELARLAGESKLRERAPQSFQQFVEQASEVDGQVQDVYVEAEILAQTLEQAGIDPNDAAPSIAEQLDEARAMNGDVRIPVGEFAARIAGQDYAEALLPHLRADPEAMSAAEAEEFNQGASEQFRAEAERVLSQQEAGDTIRASADAVGATILEQLTAANRFTADVNTAYASLMRDFYTVASQRLGITPEEMYARYPLRVTAEQDPTEEDIAKALRDGVITADMPADEIKDRLKGQGFYQAKPPAYGIRPTGFPVGGFYVANGQGEIERFGAPEGELPRRFKTVEAAQRAISKLQRQQPRAPVELTAGQVNKELDRLEKQSSKLNDELIAAGRGQERPFETRAKTDPLALRFAEIHDRQDALRDEIAARYGPGAPRRLPTGRGNKFPPRRKPGGTLDQDAQPDERGIVNPIDPTLAPGKKLEAIHALTAENKPLVDEFLAALDLAFDTESKSNVKMDENIKDKAARPSIRARRPWFDIEHVRDTLRFKSVLDDIRDLPAIAEQLVKSGWEVVKLDAEKMLTPGAWGWRMVALDLRMPNGQLVEYYLPLRELEDVKDENHKLFEKWRNEDLSKLDAEQVAEYVRAAAESNARYQSAFESALLRLGVDESAVRASLSSLETSLASAMATRSDSSTELGTKPESPGFQVPFESVAAKPSVSATETSDPSADRDAIASIDTTPYSSGILAQAEATGQARGRIRLDESGATIALLKNADLSTFLHESGHFFLEVYADIATQPGAPAEIADDFNAVLKWFGVADAATWQGMDLEARRASHEKFARGFEAYLFEGKAPTAELNSLFSRFRAWLLNVYRSLTSLNVELTDEVRGVFNRMLASEQAIEETEAARQFAPLFESAADAGMTDQEYQAYLTANEAAKDDATDKLQKRSLRDMRWLANAKSRVLKQLQKEVAQKRKAVRVEVAAEVAAEMVYKARRFLSRGEIERGGEVVKLAEHKLSLAALEEMYPDGGLDFEQLTRGKRGVTAKGGLHPDLVAEMLGFTSGDHLIQALMDAPPINDLVDARTDQVMLERYGDLTDPAALERAAEEAIHNEARARFVATEIRALNRMLNVRARTPAGGSVNVTLKAAKEFAAATIARLRIRDVRPAQFARAETRAAKAADRELRAGNTLAAATEKRNQLVNTLAVRAAYDAVNEIEKGLRYLNKFTRDGVRKNLDVEYVEQIDALLERFDLKRRPVSARDLAKRASLAQWVEAQHELGFEPAIDEAILAEANRKPYREMSVEEFRGLVDAVRNVEHLGRLKKKLLTAKDQREFEQAVDDAEQSIRGNARKTIPVELESNAFGARIKEGVKEFFAMHRKLASIVRQMDGFKDGGAMWELFIRPLNAAADREAVMREEATRKLTALFKPILKGGRLRQKLYIPAIGRSLSREGRLSIALNWGNKTNRLRVMEGDNWAEVQVNAVLDTLTKEEWDFVQSAWDHVDSYWLAVSEKEQRVTGLKPEKVEADPVQTKFGEYRGGYYPIAYDPTRSTRAEADTLAEGVRNAMRGLYTRATTRRGHTKARVESVKRPVRKDLGVIFKHIGEVTHDLAYHEYLIDANRLLRASAIDRAVRDHYGPEFLRQMRDALNDVAAGDIPGQDAWERGIHHIRVGATIAGLGWNLATGLLQPIGLTQSIVRVGPKYVARGLTRWLGSATRMENSVKWIHEKSSFMRLRAKTMQREINEIQNQIHGGGKLTPVTSSFFYLIQKLQMVADMPTWLGAYEKAMDAETDEARAIALADQAVLDAQGGGQVKDLAAIQRGSPMRKLWTNFYSFFNTTYNLSAESVRRTNFRKPADIGRLAVDYLLLYTVPASLAFFMREALRGSGDDDDELAARLARENIGFMLSTLIGVRELSGVVQGYQYGGTAGARGFMELGRLIRQAEQGKVDKKALVAVGGVLFHVPAPQVQKTLAGAVALIEGETENPGALVVGPARD